jgi:ferric-dicitrate binding protein FerR (iron transport regulator)
MTQDNRIWVLLSRRLSGEATSAEVEELMLLLERSPQKQYLYSILHSWFSDLPAAPSVQPVEDAGLEERFRKIVDTDDQTSFRPDEPEIMDTVRDKSATVRDWNAAAWDRNATVRDRNAPFSNVSGPVLRRSFLRKRLLYATSVAASVAALFLLGWSIYHPKHSILPSGPASQSVRSEEVLARAGTRTKLLLPDGTQVWLNSNSKLKYSNDFNTEVREVGLEGEAYFDVAKDVKRPFIVHTSSLDIKVLGTSFTIKSYPQDETIETTLLRGVIEVCRKDNPNTARVILKPNEKLVFNKRLVDPAQTPAAPDSFAARPLTVRPDIAVNSIRNDIPDSDKVETAWMYNRLVFKGDSFKELAAKMERWYNVRITIRDTSLNSCRFGGAFADETLEEAFKALQLTTAFTYKIRGNEIELYAKQ